MSPWWLLLIIPASFLGGYMTCGVMVSGSQIDNCTECMYNAQNKERSK